MRRGIAEKFRSALCIIRRAIDERGGGCRDEEEEEDRLSALPDDVLLLILLRLPSSAAAARTSVLSRRWRHLWTYLPELRFNFPAPADPVAARTSVIRRRLRNPHRTDPGLGRARAALAAHAAPALRRLDVFSSDADPGDAAAVLLLAAPRLAGSLSFDNEGLGKAGAAAAAAGAIELPCFEKAEGIYLRLGYLGLALPPSGVFAKLAVLDFKNVRFHGPCNLGDAVSSARCPSLQHLRVVDAQGVSNLHIHSKSLLLLDLNVLEGLQQLTVVAPMLRDLGVRNCFTGRQPVADFSVPVLDKLKWFDEYDPSSVHWGGLAQLRELRTSGDLQTEWPNLNRDLVILLQRFQKIRKVDLFIYYPPANTQYLAEVLTFLPNIDKLQLGISTLGHGVGPYIFHFLSISSGIRKLKLWIQGLIKGKSVCSPDCDCHQTQDSETEELIINSLQKVCIYQCREAGHEIVFLKRLLRCASALKTITVEFDPLVTVREELCQELLGLSKPETCMKIYLYRDGEKVMYAPVS